MGLTDKVCGLTKKIPRGQVTTYSELARALGNRRLARAVGNALNKNRNFINIPCHRVVRANGQIGGYVLGERKKIEKLRSEGLRIAKGKVVDWRKYLYRF
ncbi:MAG: MGMT family protein [Patescibacteria group bacterium]